MKLLPEVKEMMGNSDKEFTKFTLISGAHEEHRKYLNVRLRNRTEELMSEYLAKFEILKRERVGSLDGDSFLHVKTFYTNFTHAHLQTLYCKRLGDIIYVLLGRTYTIETVISTFELTLNHTLAWRSFCI